MNTNVNLVSPVIWLDGAWVPREGAHLSALTHTLHYGTGVFEGVRAYSGKNGTAIFRLREHTERLFASAALTGMEIPFSKQELNSAQQEILRRNQFTDAYIRPLVFYGAEYLGLYHESLTVHVAIVAIEDQPQRINRYQQGLRVQISAYPYYRTNPHLYQAKATGNYLPSIMALQQARAQGYDEVLFVDNQGYVAEASAANVFIVCHEKLIIPASVAALKGITRESIAQIARDLGIDVQEKLITPEMLYIADEIFFTGTLMEIAPVLAINDNIIGQGQPGIITQQLQQRYQEIVTGNVRHYFDWLAFI